MEPNSSTAFTAAVGAELIVVLVIFALAVVNVDAIARFVEKVLP